MADGTAIEWTDANPPCSLSVSRHDQRWKMRGGATVKARVGFPLANVWLGVSAEDQKRADERVPNLLATPAALRFVSAEPLLGPIEFQGVWSHCPAHDFDSGFCVGRCPDRRSLNWIIVGGESGPGARPMHPDWARSIRDQCSAGGAAFFFKQWGCWLDADQLFERIERSGNFIAHYGQRWQPRRPLSHDDAFLLAGIVGRDADHRGDGRTDLWMGKAAAGRQLDGVEHNAFPKACP